MWELPRCSFPLSAQNKHPQPCYGPDRSLSPTHPLSTWISEGRQLTGATAPPPPAPFFNRFESCGETKSPCAKSCKRDPQFCQPLSCFCPALRAPSHRQRSPSAIQRHSQVTPCLNIVTVHEGTKARCSESTSQYGYTKPQPFTLSAHTMLDLHLTSATITATWCIYFNHNYEPKYEMRSWLIPPKAPERTASRVKTPYCMASETSWFGPDWPLGE